MTGRIVVGIDGSPHSARALDWAIGRARIGGWSLHLVSVYSLPTNVDFYGYHGMQSPHPVEWLSDASKELLETAATRVRETAPDLKYELTSELGWPAQILAEASEGADLLVVGRRGLGAAASVVLGSVSNRLTVEARCPLVVIGEDELPGDGPVVVGVDDSEFGTAALRFALSEAAARGTSVRAVTAFVQPRPPAVADDELLARIHAGLEAEAADITTRALASLGDARDPSVTVEQVTVDGPAAEAILDHIDDAQLVVVGSHGKGFVRRVLLGSVSRRVLHDAQVPVAVVDVRDS